MVREGRPWERSKTPIEQEQDTHGTGSTHPWDRNATAMGQEQDIHGAGTRHPSDRAKTSLGQEHDIHGAVKSRQLSGIAIGGNQL